MSLATIAGMAERTYVVGGWYGGELAYRHKIGVIGHEADTQPEPKASTGATGAART